MAPNPSLRRLFLQSYLNLHFASEEDSLNLYRNCCDVCDVRYDPADFVDFVIDLNDTIRPVGLELRKGHTPDEGVTHYALVNTTVDEPAQLATDCTPNEIAYFKALIEMIVNAPDEAFSVSSTAVFRIPVNLGSKKDTQAFLDRLVKNQWLDDRRGKLSLSLRAVLELQNYLKVSFEDKFADCTICMDMITDKAKRCGNVRCSARIHTYCVSQWLPTQRDPKCPLCQLAWKNVSTGTRTGTVKVHDAPRGDDEEDEEAEGTNGGGMDVDEEEE